MAWAVCLLHVGYTSTSITVSFSSTLIVFYKLLLGTGRSKMPVMKIYISLLIIFFSFHTIVSQNIGDKAELLLSLFEREYDNRKTKDILKYGELQYTYDVKYGNNGLIEEITVNKKNEIFIDLQARSDITIHHLFKNNILNSTVTNFHNLKVEFLRKKFNEVYGKRKVDDVMFFTPDYRHYRYIFWDSDHQNIASVAYVEYDSVAFTEEIQELVLNNQKRSKLTQIGLQEIRKEYFEIDDFINRYSSKKIDEIEDGLVKYFKNELKNDVDINNLEQFKEVKCKYRFRIYADRLSEKAKFDITTIETNTSYPDYIKRIRIKIPHITKAINSQEYKLNREFLMNCEINLSRGVIEFKNRRTVGFSPNNQLTSVQKEWIIEKMKGQEKGKYNIIYQFGQVNEKDATAMYIKKI